MIELKNSRCIRQLSYTNLNENTRLMIQSERNMVFPVQNK